MRDEPPSPNQFDDHDDNEPEREHDELSQVTYEAPKQQIGISIKFNGIEADVWGTNLAECRAYLFDALLFMKKEFAPKKSDGDGIR